MLKIRRKISEEYRENFDSMIKDSFLTAGSATINLASYTTRIGKEETDGGINPFELLNKEDIYKIDGKLTLFKTEISNTVGELSYLNETNVIHQAMTNGLRMQVNVEAKTAMTNSLKSMLFENPTQSTIYAIANPYINTSYSASLFRGCYFFITALLILTFK